MIRRNLVAILLLTLIWLVVEFLVNPLGDFPLNDDWAYGKTVKNWIERGEFRLSDWTAANVLTQILWGTLFCLPLGFSFTALRFSTLILGLIGVLATYALLIEVNLPRRWSFLGALLVAINPIYLVLSNTFMSDVPFYALSTVSTLFLIRGLKNSTGLLVAGVLISYLAILTRQIALVIPLTFAAAYLIKNVRTASNIFKAFLPAIGGFLVQFCYQFWLLKIGGLPHSYGDQITTLFSEIGKGPLNTLSNILQIILFAATYLGLFLIPLIYFVLPKNFNRLTNRQRQRAGLVVVAGVLIGFAYLIINKKLMPLLGNVLLDSGLGPLGLDNTYMPATSIWIRMMITIAGLTSGLVFVASLFVTHPFRNEKWLTIFLFGQILFYLLILGCLGFTWRGVYDRYLLCLIPLVLSVIPIIVRQTNWNSIQKSFLPATFLVALYAGFSVAGTHDYLAANRTLWKGINSLMKEANVPPANIHGGFEFNGWYHCDDPVRISQDKALNFACLWGNKDAEYVLSFQPRNGYKEAKRYYFSTWLPFREGKLFVLQKKDQSAVNFSGM